MATATPTGPSGSAATDAAPTASPTPRSSSSNDYLAQRKLQTGTAGWFLLAGLGVAYVISGDYAGRNFGLEQGGFGGLLIALVLMGTVYGCMEGPGPRTDRPRRSRLPALHQR